MKHRYLGPQGVQYHDTVATAWFALCACKWRGVTRYSREQSKADWQLHKQRAAVELEQDVGWYRAWGLDAEVEG